MTRFAGHVKWYDSKKGYGFILPEGGGPDMFVHVSAVKASGMTALNEGDRVSYEVTTNKTNRPCAVDLEVL